MKRPGSSNGLGAATKYSKNPGLNIKKIRKSSCPEYIYLEKVQLCLCLYL